MRFENIKKMSECGGGRKDEAAPRNLQLHGWTPLFFENTHIQFYSKLG